MLLSPKDRARARWQFFLCCSLLASQVSCQERVTLKPGGAAPAGLFLEARAPCHSGRREREGSRVRWKVRGGWEEAGPRAALSLPLTAPGLSLDLYQVTGPKWGPRCPRRGSQVCSPSLNSTPGEWAGERQAIPWPLLAMHGHPEARVGAV